MCSKSRRRGWKRFSSFYLLQKKKELKSVAIIKEMQFDCIRQQIAEQGRL